MLSNTDMVVVARLDGNDDEGTFHTTNSALAEV
jgi:hypothetical protein